MSFKKIISHLAYSPAMIWHLANLDKKLKRYSKKNKKIILFCILNMAVFGYALGMNQISTSSHSSPHGVNVSINYDSLSSNLLISNPRSLESLSTERLFNEINIQSRLLQIYTDLGISKKNITNTSALSSLKVDPNHCFEISANSFRTGTTSAVLTSGNVVSSTPCLKNYYGLIFHNTIVNNQDFFILNNGNLLLTSQEHLSIKPASTKELEIDISADANAKISPDQTIVYSILATNSTEDPISTTLEIGLADILEYGDIINGSAYAGDKEFWTIQELAPHQSISKNISVKTKRSFSDKPVGFNTTTSNDCELTLKINDTLKTLPIKCPLIKQVNLAFNQLDRVAINNLDYKQQLLVLIYFMALIVLIKITYSIRLKLMLSEIKKIRYIANQGIL